MAQHIEIELDGVLVTARLLEERSPKTCELMWAALPYEDRVTHAKWSGQMFHTNTSIDLAVAGGMPPFDIESPSAYQSPGDVVYYRPAKEFGVAYGESRFCWESGPLFVTPVAVIVDDLTEFAKKGDQLVWTGAKRFVIRRKA
jgi:hypothetical protein